MNLEELMKKKLVKGDLIGITLRKRLLAGEYKKILEHLDSGVAEKLLEKAKIELSVIGEYKFNDSEETEESSGGAGKKLNFKR